MKQIILGLFLISSLLFAGEEVIVKRYDSFLSGKEKVIMSDAEKLIKEYNKRGYTLFSMDMAGAHTIYVWWVFTKDDKWKQEKFLN